MASYGLMRYGGADHLRHVVGVVEGGALAGFAEISRDAMTGEVIMGELRSTYPRLSMMDLDNSTGTDAESLRLSHMDLPDEITASFANPTNLETPDDVLVLADYERSFQQRCDDIVAADHELTMYVDSGAMDDVLRNNPQLAERIKANLESRRIDLQY